jgi:hypothetical protein
MITGCVIEGSAVAGVMVFTPAPAMLKTMVCVPANVFESVMA